LYIKKEGSGHSGNNNTLVKKINITKRELKEGEPLLGHLEAIAKFADFEFDLDTVKSGIRRWGKFHVNSKTLIHSCLSDSKSAHGDGRRYSRWFEVINVTSIKSQMLNGYCVGVYSSDGWIPKLSSWRSTCIL
jgi:hypothetical protein